MSIEGYQFEDIKLEDIVSENIPSFIPYCENTHTTKENVNSFLDKVNESNIEKKNSNFK